MKYQLVAILLAIFVAACANFETADKAIKSGEAQAALFSIEYTEEENQIINEAIKKYIYFREVWGVFDGFDYVLSNQGELQIHKDFEGLRASYLKLETVVEANFHRYDEETKERLIYYQTEAIKVDEDMRQTQSISALSRYADILLRIISSVM